MSTIRYSDESERRPISYEVASRIYDGIRMRLESSEFSVADHDVRLNLALERFSKMIFDQLSTCTDSSILSDEIRPTGDLGEFDLIYRLHCSEEEKLARIINSPNWPTAILGSLISKGQKKEFTSEYLIDKTRYLINELGADVNQIELQEQPFSRHGLAYDVKRYFEYLINEHGLDVNKVVTKQTGFTLLHYSALIWKYDIMEFLLINGANPSITNANGEDALHLALRARRTNQSEKLLKFRADIYPPKRLYDAKMMMAMLTREHDYWKDASSHLNDLIRSDIISHSPFWSNEDFTSKLSPFALAALSLIRESREIVSVDKNFHNFTEKEFLIQGVWVSERIFGLKVNLNLIECLRQLGDFYDDAEGETAKTINIWILALEIMIIDGVNHFLEKESVQESDIIRCLLLSMLTSFEEIDIIGHNSYTEIIQHFMNLALSFASSHVNLTRVVVWDDIDHEFNIGNMMRESIWQRILLILIRSGCQLDFKRRIIRQLVIKTRLDQHNNGELFFTRLLLVFGDYGNILDETVDDDAFSAIQILRMLIEAGMKVNSNKSSKCLCQMEFYVTGLGDHWFLKYNEREKQALIDLMEASGWCLQRVKPNNSGGIFLGQIVRRNNAIQLRNTKLSCLAARAIYESKIKLNWLNVADDYRQIISAHSNEMMDKYVSCLATR